MQFACKNAALFKPGLTQNQFLLPFWEIFPYETVMSRCELIDLRSSGYRQCISGLGKRYSNAMVVS